MPMMQVPEPSDAAPQYLPGEGQRHALGQVLAEVLLLVRTTCTPAQQAAIEAPVHAADCFPFSLERCSCGRLGVPCDYCHDPRMDGSEKAWALWQWEETDEALL